MVEYKSDDIGDVSWKVPTVVLRFPSNIPDVTFHHWSASIAAATPIAHKGANAGAKVVAMTALDFLTKPEKLMEAKDYFNNMNGKAIGEVVRFLQNDASEQEVRKIGIEKEMGYRKLYQPYLRPTKGLLNFLSQAHGFNIPMCIGTSASKENVDFTINLSLIHI